ncbi:MAG: DUF3943 domain-containing protein [Planctomycetota bacterium]
MTGEWTRRARALAVTAALLYGGTLFAVFANPWGYRDVGSWIVKQGSLSRVIGNFAHPIASINPLSAGRAWYTSDGNLWYENLLGHPLVWYLVAALVRTRGHGRLSTFLQAQVHSVLWEYVFEGCYVRPSGVDLIMNTAGLLIGILACDGAERLARRAAGWRWLARAINPYRGPAEILRRIARRRRRTR